MANLDPPHTPPPDSNLYKLRKKNAVESLKDAAASSTKPDAEEPSEEPSEEPDATESLTERDAERVPHEGNVTTQPSMEESDRYQDELDESSPSPDYNEHMDVPKEEFTFEELTGKMKPFNGGSVEEFEGGYRLYAKERFRIVRKDGTFGPGWSTPGRTDHSLPRRYREDVLRMGGVRVWRHRDT
ncbi:unnamed protein product [Clonostachys solani]|uniref:Uncharacterized protein n=1 Tax=Clonostachys solani TaxID=160281 RepID=A0A9N9YZF7_9HYPO|nr:unnamed protein product [Clonostachys solani]